MSDNLTVELTPDEACQVRMALEKNIDYLLRIGMKEDDTQIQNAFSAYLKAGGYLVLEAAKLVAKKYSHL